MLHLMAEKESGINAGVRRLGRDIIETALDDLMYHKYSPEMSRKIRRDADHFFDETNPASTLRLWAYAAELDYDTVMTKARDRQARRHRL